MLDLTNVKNSHQLINEVFQYNKHGNTYFKVAQTLL